MAMVDNGGEGGGVEVRVDVDRIGKAVDALLRWVEGAKEQQPIRLLDEDRLLYLVISLKDVPAKARVTPHKISVPHPIFDPEGGGQEICLIVNDLSRGMLRKDAKKRVTLEGLRVSRVLGFSKMRKDFASHEAKRKLCGSYDLFLVDRTIQPFLSKALGKAFYHKKKVPIPVDLSRGQWKSQIESVCGSTFLFFSKGTCSLVKAARLSQSREEIVENLVAVIGGVVGLMPKKWESVLALHLKTIDSLALPVYQSKPSFPIKIDASVVKNYDVVKLAPLENAAAPTEEAAAPTLSKKHKIKGSGLEAAPAPASSKKQKIKGIVAQESVESDASPASIRKQKNKGGGLVETDTAPTSSKKKKVKVGTVEKAEAASKKQKITEKAEAATAPTSSKKHKTKGGVSASPSSIKRKKKLLNA